ncbi:MAG: dTDP-4-dehydrorhamnose 3,5-epimerase family protein [Bacteroidetes bacterium]|nr:dTDP-4-dehydrorhamnose 3,5-epimerase family protein [Bacteroidota bacterium]
MLSGMIKTDLNIIETDSGSVYHGLKKSDKGFNEFGEVYFSTIKKGAIRAWKMHKKMTLNLIVPVGKVQFCFFDGRDKSDTFNEKFKIILSQNPYVRLTIPPGIWFGFQGVSNGLNLICNVANIPHEPNEVLRKEMNEIEMDWSVK